MTCTNCGSAFHEKWACTKPLKVAEEAISTAALREVHDMRLGEFPEGVSQSTGPTVAGASRAAEAAGQSLPPVDTMSVPAKATTRPLNSVEGASTDAPKRGRPKTITDMRTYKATKAKEYRARKKDK